MHWDEELTILVDAAISLHRKEFSTHLFSTRDRRPDINDDGNTSGFDSTWQRFMRKALTDTELAKRFTEHDLRAKNACDEDDERIASKRLSHSTQAMTAV